MTSPDMMVAMVASHAGPPDVLQLCHLPVPVPGPGQARIKIAYVGLNPVDAMLRRQRLDWLPVTFPFIPGAEHSGVIDAIGPDVDASWLGRRVLSRLGFGGYAQYSVARVSGLVPLDDRISMALGCAFRGCTFTAWHALHGLGRIAPGERVLVHSAAGAVGAVAMQIAEQAGATVVGLAGGSLKTGFARQFGNTIIDYLDPAWSELASAAVGGRGFDIILDGNGGPNAAFNATLVAPLGRLIYIGNSANAPAPLISVDSLIAGSFSVGGMTLQQVEKLAPPAAAAMLTEAVAVGQLRVPISETVPLVDVAKLHARLENRELHGRVVIRVDAAVI